MAAVATMVPHNGLHTVSSSVPMIYSTRKDYHRGHNHATFNHATFHQSSSTETLLDNSYYERTSGYLHNSRAFINSGFYSSDCEERSYTTSDWKHPEKVGKESRERKRSNVTMDDARSNENVVSSSKHDRDMKIVEVIRRTSVPNLLRPQTLIKLLRATSESNSPILDNGHRSEAERVVNFDVKQFYASTEELSRKRGGYFNKVRAIFKRKSTSNLGKLVSQSCEELTRHVAFKINNTHNKEEAPETVPEPRRGSSFNGASDNVEQLKDVGETGEKKEHAFKRFREVVSSPNEACVMNAELNEDLDCTSSNSHSGQLERNYSVTRGRVQGRDSARLSVTRLPSVRKPKVQARLLYDFLTTSPAAEGPGGSHVIKQATHIHAMGSGEAFVTDILSNSLVLFDPDGHPKVTFSMESGSEPWATCLTPEGCLAVTLKKQGCVSLWTCSGEPVSEFGHGVLLGPAGIQCDRQGRFIVVDEEASSVCVFDNCGELVAKLEASTGDDTGGRLPQQEESISPVSCCSQPFFNQPRYVCITNSGNYVISDSANHSVKIFDKNFNFATQFGSYGRQDGHFKFPYGVACDDQNNLYVADHFNNRVSLFSPEGRFIEHVLTLDDGVSRPKSLSVHDSLLYVTHGDTRTNKVSVFELNSQI